MKTTHIPPYDEWSALLVDNRVRVDALRQVVGETTVRAVRREVIEAASLYTSRLGEVAQRVGATLALPMVPSDAALRPVVMAGHQPVIYHAGLLEKVTRLQSLSAGVRATAINVTIDTDEGDGGRLIWPLIKDGDVIIKQGSLSEGGALYRDQRVGSARTVSDLFTEVCRDLEASGKSEATQSIARVSNLYQALSGESISMAHAIVRMSENGAGYVELPLSELVELPTIREIIRGMFNDASRFVAVYNATLEAYRREHRIKNQANPFPNMTIEGDRLEMPFWQIAGGARRAVWVTAAGNTSSSEGCLVAPRGSIVTLLLRGLCSDLLIHGLGGGKYDRFVDAFGKAYWGAELPTFVVASATRYLFPQEVGQYLHARELKSTYKDMVSHTSKFLGQGLFSQGEEADLASLVARRQSLLEELPRARSNEDRSPIVHALNEVNRSIKARIDISSIANSLADGGIDDARLARWSCREYPFFFFHRESEANF